MNSPEILDTAGTLSNLDGDMELYRELLGVFREDVPVQIDCLKNAYKAQDVKLVERQAHTVKGAASNVGALQIKETAFKIESAARSGDLSLVAPSLIEALSQAHKALEDLLHSDEARSIIGE